MVDAADVDILAEAHVIADDEARREMLLVLAFTVRGDGLHPEPPARREVLADLHVFHAANIGVVMDVDVPLPKIQREKSMFRMRCQ